MNIIQKILFVSTFFLILLILFCSAVLAGTDITKVNRNGPVLESHENQNETCLTKNPAFPNNIVIAHNDQNGGVQVGPSLGISYTTDNATTWNHTHIPYVSPSGATGTALMTFDPAVAADTQGNIYATYIQDEPNTSSSLYTPPVGVWISKSSNQGASWENTPNAVRYFTGGNRYLDKSWITVDTYGSSQYTDNIYVCWQEDDLVSGLYSYIYFSKSSANNYPSFTTPIKISESGRPNPFDNAPVPAVAPNGDIYIAWMDSDITNTNCPPGKIRLKKSTDGGQSFQAPSPSIGSVTVASFNNAIQKFPIAGGFKQTSFPSIACDPTNHHNVYVVYAADPDGGTAGPDQGDVYFVSSNNGGSTWSVPKKISDDAGMAGQFQPWIKVKPNGFIDIVWIDGRNDATGLNWNLDVYMTTSTDGGQTFRTNQRVSDISFDVSQGGTGWIGEYPGLDVDTSNAYIAWTDTGIGPTRPIGSFVPDRDIYFDVMSNPVNTTVGATSIVGISRNLTATVHNVSVAGNTFASLVNLASLSPPAGHSFITGGSYYGYFDLTSTAVFSGNVDIDFTYDENIVGPDEADLKMFHWTGTSWEEITNSIDTVNNIISGQTSSLSIIALVLPIKVEPKAYLPNVTMNYFGWTTPFIVQNLSSQPATINVQLYKKGESTPVYEETSTAVAPYSSLSVNPSSKLSLPSFQGSAVISADQEVAAIVNEHSKNASMSYEGIDPTKAETINYLPNITRDYFGWNTPFVVQNVGSQDATINVEFYRKGEATPTYEETFTALSPGSSIGFNPSGKPLGTFQGSVIVKSTENIGSIVNEHYGSSAAMSYNGFVSGENNAYLPNITRNYYDWTTPFMIQNMGTLDTTITVDFYGAGESASSHTVTITALAPGTGSNINPSSISSLGVFQGSVIASSSDSPIVAVCNEHSSMDAMSYTSIGQGSNINYLPNIVKNYFGWNTPLIIQNQYSEDETVTIRFYNKTGVLVKTISNQVISGGSSVGINPAKTDLISGFVGSVVVESDSGKKLATIVNEQHISGQAMAYNGF